MTNQRTSGELSDQNLEVVVGGSTKGRAPARTPQRGQGRRQTATMGRSMGAGMAMRTPGYAASRRRGTGGGW